VIATELVLAVLLFQWLVFMGLHIRRLSRPTETMFLVSTVVMAFAWTMLAVQWRLSDRTANKTAVVRRQGCAAVQLGMSVTKLRTAMGSPARTVSESDERGPGAEAWVYDNAGCVAHVLNEQVRAIDE
jgi:hypothetical protein